MQDGQILSRIKELIAEEHELRSQLTTGEVSEGEEHSRVRALEEELDQCWDLLRQRRAHREFGEDPDHASPRPVNEVENYWQ
ncbi:hypothetical protein Sme01_15780 [Sphaerisporangium melleum]|uniref:DUF2630 domain-containing protein n=1 Tax=Sphaerisporangium melleum TaxID=321316 RepID=A0A917RJ44_9ACTN|nr:DUF2630 family protein [Sphaerisporangium melleum]GGL10785.1 hypothetical protein GCM10007964_61260 [Sphaerisporangium melleum]GII69102.1 hypothetical protein Sme01_15780 [Sphaerisporangium melleum]